MVEVFRPRLRPDGVFRSRALATRRVFHSLPKWACLGASADAPRIAYSGWRRPAAPSPSCHSGPNGLEVVARHARFAWWLPCQFRVGVEGVAAYVFSTPCARRLCPAWWGYAPLLSALEACHARTAQYPVLQVLNLRAAVSHKAILQGRTEAGPLKRLRCVMRLRATCML